ncbi:MAG: arylesterase [Acidobacteriota bacterium]|nr:arylesterase [Acidobacteriota bacterium]
MLKQILLLGLVLFGFLLATACDEAKPAANPREAMTNANAAAPMTVTNTKAPKIIAFGDSLTIGLGLTEKESYPSLLQEKLKADGYEYEVINAGVSGDTSAGGLERIDWALNQPNIEILILELGANDMLRGQSVSKMKENLREIIKRAKAKNIKVLLCGMLAPPSLGVDYMHEYAAAFRDLAKEEQVAFLPFFLEGVGGVKSLNQSDGIHPNAEGTKKVAETVYKSLTPLLNKTRK